MSITTQFQRIETDRNNLRSKLVAMGLATGTDNLDTLVTAVQSIIDQGAVAITISEGNSYTIPRGFHNGSGTVTASDASGNYKLQEVDPVTPTKQQQNIAPAEGFYGLQSVTVNPIPDNFQDVSSVDATAEYVYAGKIIVDSEGNIVTGEMQDHGAVAKSLNTTTISYTIPKGFHPGTGVVSITLETKTATPSKSIQNIKPTTGKVLSEVTVAAIPDEYQDVTGVTATAAGTLVGQSFVDTTGALVAGEMPDNTPTETTLDTTTTSHTIPAGRHSGTGTVKIAPVAKSATPTKAIQEVTPGAGQVLSKVTVGKIPDAYQDVTPVTATAAGVVVGQKFVNSLGEEVDGEMPVNGDITATIDGITTTSVQIPAGNTTGGTVSLTNDIETRLAAI